MGLIDEVGSNEGQHEALERLRNSTDFTYRMFHAHNRLQEQLSRARADGFSPTDIEIIGAAKEKILGNKNYFEVLIAPSHRLGEKIQIIPSDPEIRVGIGYWDRDDGTPWFKEGEVAKKKFRNKGGKVKTLEDFLTLTNPWKLLSYRVF